MKRQSLAALAVALLLLPAYAVGYHELSLDGDDWIAYDAGKEHVVASRVPGSIYTDLYRNGTIGDPYFGYGDVEYAWIGQRDWTFEKQFDWRGASLLTYTNIVLQADGIDTVCNVTLNGALLGATQNMHIDYAWSVRKFMQTKANKLVIACTSPVQAALARSKQYPYVVPPQCPPALHHGQCHVNFLRKEASSFSWDWGPAFPTTGIWKSLKLVGYQSTYVEHMVVNTTRLRNSTIDRDDWELKFDLYLHDDNVTHAVAAQFEVEELGINWTVRVTPPQKFSSVAFRIPRANVSLWWPSGYGTAKLYTAHVTFFDCPEEDRLAFCRDTAQTLTKQFAFRTVEIRQLAVDSADPSSGLTFKFYINDVFVWVKGSNWIPAHAFNELATDEYVEQLLQSAHSVHMNMLRVWGGGRYQSDFFYDTCDRLGIMIWHDFMFACAMYPTDAGFLTNVRDEVLYQVKRLSTHPSIALWAGNNENEVALAQHWYPEAAADPKRYAIDYELLYNQTIWQAVNNSNEARPFVPSSPSNGPKSVASPYMLDPDPQSWLFGDVHFYSYFTDPWDTATFPVPRFVSEFGIQSWPSEHTLRKSAGKETLAWFSNFTLHRQHAPSGQASMLYQISLHFPVPSWPTDFIDDALWIKLVYLSQLNQACGIRAQVEHYRSMRDRLVVRDVDKKKIGLTAGTMYWQLNQIWPAPSWSSLEFGGRWKMLHYFAAKFYAPVLIRSQVVRQQLQYNVSSNDIINVDVISDLHDAALQGTLTVQIYAWKVGVLLGAQAQASVSVAPGATATVDGVFNLNSLLAPTGHTPEECVVRLTFNFTRNGSSEYEVTENHLLLASYYTPLVLPQIKLTITNAKHVHDSKTIGFTLKKQTSANGAAPGVAAFVWLESPTGGRFSDNSFIMFDDQMQLEFYGRREWISVEDFVRTLNITALADVIQ